MSDCTHDCSTCSVSDCKERGIQKEKQNDFSNVKKVIGIVSGKGGVGKSLVTSLLAVAFSKKGKKVAILDGDITGPSIPKMFGISETATSSDGVLLNPCVSKKGVKVMSMNLLLPDSTSPVVWRGPVIAGAVKQFWTDVAWGEVDYMFVDMPPGTGDVPLTVFQSLPIDGIIIVTSPQELVSMIVEKAVNMAKMMNIPILGVVENMSYFVCPTCSEKIKVFGDSQIDKIASNYGITAVDSIPIDSKIAHLADKGEIENADNYIENIVSYVENNID